MSSRGLVVGLVLLTAVNMVALALADWLFDSVTIVGFWPLLIAGLVLGIANAILKPVLTLLTLPLVIVTLGLFLLVINIAMIGLAEWIAPDFSIDGFWTYVGVVIVVSLVNWLAGRLADRSLGAGAGLRPARATRRVAPTNRRARRASAPPATRSPGATCTAFTVASNGDVTGCSIFIASSTTSACRGWTASPGETSTESTIARHRSRTDCAPPWAA